ncbi:hypothetical protein ACN9KC_02310 [Aliarcobacter butzleri]|uniref:hypothetical protein n=1 Tax=Aliarcobacter butzleri TaxID=28197 RepID=UPI003B2188A9
MNRNFKNLINKYHPIGWLLKSIERTRKRNLSDLSNKINISSRTEFLVILSDIALRVSQNEKLSGKIPTDNDFMNFINFYINTEANKFSNLIEEYGILSLPLYVHEQNKYIYPEMNLIGRMLVLYRKYEKDIKTLIGLEINDILAILLELKGQYENKDFFIFEEETISYEGLDILSNEKIKKFLNYFSITIKNYKLKLKELGFDKNKLYSFRLLERYPIIKIDYRYIVPSIDNLLYSLTFNLNIHLLEHYANIGKGGKYHHTLGYHFENYIEKLSKYVFEDITPSSEIVPNDTLNSEFVIKYDDSSIAVEVKKFNFRRDTAFKNSIEDLDELSQRHLLKAFAQIETTLKYVTTTNNFGIIVIFGDLNMHSMVKNYLQKEYPIYKKENGEEINLEYPDNIIIMSVGTYESLLSNSPEDIFKIIKTYLAKEKNQRGDILQTISAMRKEATHQLLRDTYNEVFASFKLEKYK